MVQPLWYDIIVPCAQGCDPARRQRWIEDGNLDEALWHPDAEDFELNRVLAALADPHRRRVVLQLARADGPCLCATFSLPVAKATRTHHFRVLRGAGLIRQVDLGNGRSNT
ncbi:helix-turn-helix transcriptional regulator, partial [Bradyrhizobium sp. IC4060]|nr:helix-turn-helix transcriptional regulator [Bradyrhizobium sp. IC4060]